MKSKLLPIPFILLGLGGCLYAQPWAGIIGPNRAIDWSAAGTTIPTRSTICSTLSPGATGAQINSAISSCLSGQVVFLNAGTYNISGGIIMKSNVTLRGAGADQTKIIFASGSSCGGPGADLCMLAGSSYPGGPAQSATWTSGYAKGTTSITLSTTAGLVAGSSMITLDQLDDSDTDTGTIWICQDTACSSEGAGGTGRSGRAQSQKVLVTAITGSTVTISPGLYMPNWRSSQSPGAYWSNSFLVGAGVEYLSMDHSASTSSQAGIFVLNAYNCWVMGIRDINSQRSHIWVYDGNKNTFRDSYFYGTQNAASESYGIEMFNGGDNLVENNIFQRVAAPMILNGASSGSVYGYNYAVDDYYSPSPAWMAGGNFLHSGGIDNLLLEGNNSTGLVGDQIHGTHHFVTAFRNYFVGWETGKTAQTVPDHLQAGSRYFNIIGNVLGEPGYHTGYECAATSVTSNCATSGDLAIHTLGFSGNEGTHGSFPNDLNVKTTLMRWGNYDTVNGAVRFVSTEVPTGIASYANAVPGSQTLPASFYQPGKPAWFGNIPWPPIGPDVTAGNMPDLGGHVNIIPSQLCYNGAGIDAAYGSSSVRVFSASSCYSNAISPRLPPPITVLTPPIAVSAAVE